MHDLPRLPVFGGRCLPYLAIFIEQSSWDINHEDLTSFVYIIHKVMVTGNNLLLDIINGNLLLLFR